MLVRATQYACIPGVRIILPGQVAEVTEAQAQVLIGHRRAVPHEPAHERETATRKTKRERR